MVKTLTRIDVEAAALKAGEQRVRAAQMADDAVAAVRAGRLDIAETCLAAARDAWCRAVWAADDVEYGHGRPSLAKAARWDAGCARADMTRARQAIEAAQAQAR